MAVRILADDGSEVAAGEPGTVYFAAASGRRFRYQGDVGKTEGAHQGDAFTVGDIGRVDDDGYLYLCGRTSDVVVSAGVNIYPAEVDEALADVTGVRDLCAVGGPDDERGEVIVLYVALEPGADQSAVVAELERMAALRLAPYKRPRQVMVVAEIPRDETGKLLRRVLRDRLWEGREPV
jgi:long-chain acyl-CoA synthetase